MASFDATDEKLWFFGQLSRQEAEGLLKGQEPGLFLVRDSTTSVGDFVLSVSENNKVSHYIIEVKKEKYHIGELHFQSLTAVIEFYKVHYLDTTTLTRPVVLGGTKYVFDEGIKIRSCVVMYGNKEELEETFGRIVTWCPKQETPSPAVEPASRPVNPVIPHPDIQEGLNMKYLVKYNFPGEDEEDLPCRKGEILVLLQKEEDNWWKMRNDKGKVGLVPKPYIEQVTQPCISEYQPINSNEPVLAIAVQPRVPTPYDYTQLRLDVGDLVKVLQRNTSGQWEGEVFGKDKKGFFPFRCVRVLEGIEREEALKTLQASNGPGQTKGSGDGPHRPSNGLVD
ncbi:Crk-like protein [Holothuria leucospilota]|uniref:Crk-like protein n=1 Tax=Holothuria leucospilota TaxID=206669 RepID=A0A9Q1HLX6_HOLLE|nr:Crk-like protein [Holothuria leucospilota]